MDAENLAVNERGYGHHVEHQVDLFPNLGTQVFTKFFQAFSIECEILLDLSAFVIA